MSGVRPSNLGWNKHVENIKMANFEALGIKEWDFMTVWILKKLKRFIWNKIFQKFKLAYKLTL